MRGDFEWVQSDCGASAGRAFEALHGVDPIASIRGTYSGPLALVRMCRAHGGAEQFAAATLEGEGLVPVPVAEMDAGDMALVPASRPLGAALGLAVAPGVVAVKGRRGMTIWRGEILRAWRLTA